MAVLETETHGAILVLRMNRPERLNALNTELREAMAATWAMFRESRDLEVAIGVNRLSREIVGIRLVEHGSGSFSVQRVRAGELAVKLRGSRRNATAPAASHSDR